MYSKICGVLYGGAWAIYTIGVYLFIYSVMVQGDAKVRFRLIIMDSQATLSAMEILLNCLIGDFRVNGRALAKVYQVKFTR